MRTVSIIVLALFFPVQVMFAGQTEWKQNTHLLPQYCKDRALGKSGSFEKWNKVFGEAGSHMHHYCKGIYAEKRAKSMIESRQRDALLKSVMHQMQYVSNRGCGVGCVLYPDLHSRWGWALNEAGNTGEAIKHYRLAIQAKPTYTSAYAGLSDLYADLDLSDEAIKVLESGLKANPKSRKLKRRLEKLQTTP